MVIDMISAYRATAMLPLPLFALLLYCYLRLSRRQEVAAKSRSRTARVKWLYMPLHMHCVQKDAVQLLL